MRNDYYLRELKIEVNRSCPLWCLHCSSNGMPGACERLEPSRVADLIKEFAYLGGEKLAISGGEPLCYEGLPLILDVCRTSGIQTELYTTGIYSNGGFLRPISEKMLTLLAESGVRVIFSLHGACAKTHDALTRVEGSFNTTITALERTLTAGISAEVHVVPTAINFREIADIVRLLAPINIKKVSWLRFVPQGRGRLNRDALQLSQYQIGQLAQTKAELQHTYQTVEIRTGAPFNILGPECPVPCVAGLSMLTIRPDGRVAPCDAFKQFRAEDGFSHVLVHSLSEAWNKSYLLNQVRRMQELRSSSPCASCPLYARCNSGCLAQKAIASGRLVDGKDPDCLLDRLEVGSGEVEAILV